MSESLLFNFHNVVGVEVQSDDLKLREFYLQEFHRTQGQFPEHIPKVILSWNKRTFLDPTPDGFQFHAHKLFSRWVYRIAFSDKKIEINARGNELAIPMVHHMLVHPAIRYLSSLQNVLMLHASAVVIDGKSILLSGKGGAGKTTTSSLLLASGGSQWKLHADDYVFIDPKMRTFGYLTRSHLYLDILRWIPGLSTLLTPWERTKLEFFGRLRALTRDGLKWPLRIAEDRLWPNRDWAANGDLHTLLWLRRIAGGEVQLTKALVDNRLIDELLEMNFNEARHFISLVKKARAAGLRQNWLDEWKVRERGLIQENLLRASIYRLDLPEKPDVETLGTNLVKRILTLLNTTEQWDE
jgi:hypothetical protein